MKEMLNSLKMITGFVLFFIFIMPTSSVRAQDFESNPYPEVALSGSLLLLSASFDTEHSSNPQLFQSKKNQYSFNSLAQYGTAFKNKNMVKAGNALTLVTHYFIRHFNVDDLPTDNSDSDVLLKSKIKTGRLNQNDFGLNLSFNIAENETTIIKMSGLTLESYWKQTFFNAVYHYEKGEIEFGLSYDYLNRYLLNGMKLELQANPSSGFGAILFTMSL